MPGPAAAAGSAGGRSAGTASAGSASTGSASAGSGAGGGGTLAAPRVEDEDETEPDTAVGPAVPADPLTDAGYRRPSRTRLLAAVAAVAILGVTGVTGTLVVMHNHQTVAAVPAATSTAAGAASGPAGAGEAGSASPAPAAPRWSSPVPVDPQTLPASSAQITGLACPKRTVCYATDERGHGAVPQVRRDLAGV